MPGKRMALLALLTLFAASTALTAGPSISLKFYGGSGYWPNGGDLKALFQSTAARWERVGYTGSFDLDWKPPAFEGGMQAIFGLSPRLSLALGVGCLKKTINQEHLIETSPLADTSMEESYRFSSFPLTLDAVYALSAGSFKLNLFAGAGLYPTSFTYESQSYYSDQGRPAQPNWTWDLRSKFDSRTVWVPGLQLGLGLEFRISETIFLCVDALYRKASFDDLVGNYEMNGVMSWTGGGSTSEYKVESARVWYSESLIWGENWYYMDFSESKPTTSDDSRLFKFDLGGPVARIGFRIRL